ncbi:MAG: hypothetical protein GX879_02210 [Bacteroidales bacterium]|nr:hypothetical protein [Bacteroidales bacterium]
MSKLHLESKVVVSPNELTKLYEYLSDFRNLESIMPPEVEDKNFEQDFCSFSVKGQKLSLNFVHKEPYDYLKITSSDAPASEFYFWAQFKKTDESKTAVKLTIKAEVNMFMLKMVKKPLQSALDAMATRLTQIVIP